MQTCKINFTKAIQTRRLTKRVSGGIVEADGDEIYRRTNTKVALSEP
jgi:3-hydroxyacyl-[acyl-carrier protein] dehydratase/trans-2-decenoyl-[acyl-carrier protein] isomerase